MDNNNGTANAPARERINCVLNQLLIARASDLACSGQYVEAERLLTTSAGLLESEAATDLLARIAIHQGQTVKARRLWESLPRFEPARSALARLTAGPIAERKRGVNRAFTVIGVFVCIALGVIALRLQKDIPHAASIRTSGNAMPLAQSKVQTSPTLHISIDGISQKQTSDCIVITFDKPMFSSGERLKPEARRLLTQLAEQLRPDCEGLECDVIGSVMIGELAKVTTEADYSRTELQRAVAVIEILQGKSGIAVDYLSAKSGGAKARVMSSEKPSRNAGVTIRVTRLPLSKQ